MGLKAQISAEFIAFLGFVFMIAIAVIALSVSELRDFELKKESGVVQDIALKLQKELLIATSVEDGYIRYFEMADKIETINYSVTNSNTSLTVVSKNSLYMVPIPSVRGNLSKGINKVNKTGGVIYVN